MKNLQQARKNIWDVEKNFKKISGTAIKNPRQFQKKTNK